MIIVCSFLAFNKQSPLHVKALGFFFFFTGNLNLLARLCFFQMPDPQQGLGSAGTRAPLEALRRKHLRRHHDSLRRDQTLVRKSNPAKSARRNQHPYTSPLRHHCNSRQHFGHLIPETIVLTFLRGKTTLSKGKYW